MLNTEPSYQSNRTCRYTFLLLTGILSGFFLYAQDDTIASPVIIEAKPVEDYTSDEEQEVVKPYFLTKNEYDSLRFQIRTIPDSVLKKLQSDEAYWYANGQGKRGDRTAQPRRDVKNGYPSTANKNSYKPVSQQGWFQALMWIIIIGGFATALIWYLAGSNVGLFRKKDKKINVQEEEEMPEDIFAINYQSEIDKAAAQENYRLAIRLMYLRLLKTLSERNIIQYKQDRTNLDYMMQLQSTRYYNNFFRITRNYEYSWYGKFSVSNDAYTIIKKEFDNFENTTS